MLIPVVVRDKLSGILKVGLVALGLLLLSSRGFGEEAVAGYRPVSKMNPRHVISIIYVNEKTEKALGPFPIDRKYYAQLVEMLEPAAPQYLILKFFYTDPRPGDAFFIQTLKKYRNILTEAAAVPEKNGYSTNQLARFCLGKNNFHFPDSSSVWTPYPELADAFAGIGGTNVVTDGTVTHGVSRFRGVRLVSSWKGELYPSLPLLILEMEKKQAAIVGGCSVKVGDTSIPITSDGGYTIDLSPSGSLYRDYSFEDVLEGRVPATTFKNQVVIVFVRGPPAPYFRSSYAEPHNAAEIAADAINTVLKK